MALVVLIIIGLVIWLCIKAYQVSVQFAAERDTFYANHEGWDIYASAHGRGVVAIHHDKRRIAVGTIAHNIELPWTDLTSVEIERNGASVQQTNRGSQAMGSLVGAALLGPVGLLLGGATASKRTREQVNELALRVTIDDREEPFHRIIFFKSGGNGVDPRSRLLKEPVSQLERFNALLANAMRSDQRVFSASLASPAPQPLLDTTSQISRLWDLKVAGALTDDEYAAQKAALLAPAQVSITAPAANSIRPRGSSN